MPVLPAGLRRLTPVRLRDDVRLRALAVGCGLIPPRTMHSAEDASVLLGAAAGARRVVEIGVYEGSSAVVLCEALRSDAELHLVDPFGHHPDALPSGWGATEWATRRVLARAQRRRGPGAPSVHWHVCLSAELASSWRGGVDLVFVDGDHAESGCGLTGRRGLRSSRWAGMSYFTTPAPTSRGDAVCRDRRPSSRATSARVTAVVAEAHPGGRSSPSQIARSRCGGSPESCRGPACA